ncbi:MAG: hypothetical protein OHK0029_29080 [Armatimonadaceae bacterium]
MVILAALIGLSAAGIFAAVQMVPPAGWSSNDVTTGKHPGYPDLHPHRYDMSVNHTTIFAAEAARRLGWEVTRTDPQAGIVEAVVTVKPIPFKDDVTVTVTPDDTSGGKYTMVTIHSRSRVGSGDLGENARHIRALQAAMDDKLPRVDE